MLRSANILIAPIGSAPSYLKAVENARRVAGTAVSVLITGETGSGKELLARLIHQHSPRQTRAYVAFNCAALPDSLLENELFGHEKGAYTGADSGYDGKFLAANGGTIFLDEIGDLSLHGQARLLRVLETHQVVRLGSKQVTDTDFRLVAATNHDLLKCADEGTFRLDLYYRINVARIHLPPLRDRREDIQSLAHHFLDLFRHDYPECPMKAFSKPLMMYFESYHWPGNIRELRNAVEGLAAFSSSGEAQLEDLGESGGLAEHRPQGECSASSQTERKMLVSALEAVSWNKKRAAEQLHCSRMTVYRKMAQYSIPTPGRRNTGTDS
jgi:transcriptional regulator with PAS, ATPase and Fis domain